MAGKEEGSCSSCFKTTKYTCLTCKEYFCMPRSVFENDEDVVGWMQGSSVAYCEPCFREKMEREMISGDGTNDKSSRKREGQRENTSTSEGTPKRKTTDDSFDDSDEEQDDEEKEIDDIDDVLQIFVKKGKGAKKKKSGRRSRWPEKALDDLIDIVVSNSNFKTKLISTNSKNQRNGSIYEKVLEELKVRASSRGEEITFTANQLRSKFKKCVGFCKQAALTQRTATGIKRFQEDHGFGKWFHALFEVVKTRDSCQPERALEPSSSHSGRTTPSSEGLEGEEKDPLFVPVKNVRKKQTTKEKLDATTLEAMNLVRSTIKNDPTKELISFMREEMEKSREHEFKFLQLMLSQRPNGNSDSFQTMQSSGGIPFGDTGYYPNWNGGFAPGSASQLRMPDASYGNVSPAPMMPPNAGNYHQL